MFKTYFKIAWRNIFKNRFYSAVNIIGLSAGLLFGLLIGVYVWNELRINHGLHHAKNQYFLTSKWKNPNIGQDFTTLGPLARRLKEDYPSLVANYYRWDGITSVVSKGEKHLRENIQLGDSTMLSMYGFPLLYGNAATALNDPYSAVITPKTAVKYFGKTDVVGQTLTIQSFSGTQHEFTITGVLGSVPENSVTQLNDANHNDLFIPTNTYQYFGRNDFESWSNVILPSYIELRDGVQAEALEGPLKKLIAQNSAPDWVKQNLQVTAVPLTRYYLGKNNALVTRMLYALSFVGVFILLMAVVNFINISISNATSRTREIGIRKVIGGEQKQIIWQFLAESVILVLLAMLIAVTAYSFVRPLFEKTVGKEILPLAAFSWYSFPILVFVVLVVGILAGFYPAFLLSSYHPVDSLKGKLKTAGEKSLLRKSLVGFQFAIAGTVMIAAFVVSRQVSHFFDQSLGYNKDFIVSSQVPRNWSSEGVRKMETVRNEFAGMPQVSQVSLSYEIPNGMNGGQPAVYKAGTDSTTAVGLASLVTDAHYLDTYAIPLAAGTFYNAGDPDTTKVVLNEKAVAALGWQHAEEAIGKQVRITGSPLFFTVQGVTRDFHFSSMQQEIQPMIFVQPRLALVYRFLSFKIKPGEVSKTIEAIQKKWSVLLPGSQFEFSFMDDTLQNLYKQEIQLKRASYTATVLSLVIVLLGILGLVSLSVQKRTKEIGIRKVLGSSVYGILVLFMKEFLTVIFVAGSVACPVAYLIMHNWLQGYAHRIQLTAVPFVSAVLLLAFVSGALICLQTVRAARSNPARNLRTE
ncbi:MAG: FtsX-like permease family protein [Williamsia sp.]|nr:FtsX-like permease family protein [Williamsia sp.]